MREGLAGAGRTAWLAAVFPVAALVACSPSAPTPGQVVAPPNPPVPAEVAVADDGPVANLRGYYEARDGGLFTVCAETTRRRIDRIGDADAQRLAQAAGASPDARFVAARGDVVDRDTVGIDEIEIIAGAAWNCESRFDGFLYAARGTAEPWSLEVTSASITFADEPGAPPLVVAYAPFVGSASERTFTAGDVGGPLRITLREEPCAEPLTDTVFPLAARVEVGERSFTGCAWRGEPER